MIKATVVLPTYNERENITKILSKIRLQEKLLEDVKLSILVVDDNSPDGTGELVEHLQRIYPNIHLLRGAKNGLGKAYIRGFKYAMSKLKADVVFEMDADLSHDPRLLPFFIHQIKQGADFVIGSRYIPGGSIPENWPKLRKANSKWGNIFARFVAGIAQVKDCTSGYRAIRTSVLKKIDLDHLNVKGYSFQMNLLHKVVKSGYKITEIPLKFADRVKGNSKLNRGDIFEFIFNALLLRFPFLKQIIYLPLIALGILPIYISYLIYSGEVSINNFIYLAIALISSLLTAQGIFSLYLMLYIWNNAEEANNNKSPQEFISPKTSFTAIVPARHEARVISDTIRAISDINYPENLKQLLVVCRSDDHATIIAAKKIIDQINKPNIHLIAFDGRKTNKPHGLNIGLSLAKKKVVVVFDAEDQPHRDIYQVVNTVMVKEKVDVIQSGVQLMNFRSSWFSTLNVLEYFFWFKSTLHFYSKRGIIPLAGNTVFIKKEWLDEVGGWDEKCLTEDADIGIRLSLAGAKIRVIYDEKHVTQEETPPNLKGLIKQRTRWDQGFIQVFLKGEWQLMPTFFQRTLAVYLLLMPQLQAFLFVLFPISLLMSINIHLPIWVTLATIIPFYLLMLQVITYIIGLYLFTKDYGLKHRFWYPLIILFTFYPYQLVLGFSAFRAIHRYLFGQVNWEKTHHLNAHRNFLNSPKFLTNDI